MSKTILVGVVLISGLALVASRLSVEVLVLICLVGAFLWYKFK